MQILILAGGSGTRFWPLSRRLRPKQMVALEGERSLLQATCDRLSGLVGPESIWVCTSADLAGDVGRQLPDVPAGQILAEPAARNTTAAIGWSLLSMPAELRRGVVTVLPADHRMQDAAAFRGALELAGRAVRKVDRVVTLGVEPHRAETGYGYLEMGERIAGEGELREVRRFREKPDAESAKRYLEAGNFLWNAGIFVFRGDSMVGWIERFEPEVGRALRQIEADPSNAPTVYPSIPSISIDYAVMERLDKIAGLPLDCGWSDLGSWQALAEALPSDSGSNTMQGDVVAFDSRDNLLWADEGSIAVIGIEGLVVVRTEDAVLVIPKERSQEVRQIVDELRARRREDLL